MEKKRELVRRADVDELIDGIAGAVLTHCRACLRGVRRVAILRSGAASSGSCSRCAPRWPMSASRWPTRTASRRWMRDDIRPLMTRRAGETNPAAGLIVDRQRSGAPLHWKRLDAPATVQICHTRLEMCGSSLCLR